MNALPHRLSRCVRRSGLVLLAAALLLLSPAAYAEDGPDAGGGDLKKQIQAKMEKILELMRENEAALLKLSTGKAAATRKVDVEVPPADGKDGAGGESGAEGKTGSSGAEGDSASKEIEKLLETLSKKGGIIPDEIKQLVEMIPT